MKATLDCTSEPPFGVRLLALRRSVGNDGEPVNVCWFNRSGEMGLSGLGGFDIADDSRLLSARREEVM
jgi:hypothetical protein